MNHAKVVIHIAAVETVAMIFITMAAVGAPVWINACLDTSDFLLNAILPLLRVKVKAVTGDFL